MSTLEILLVVFIAVNVALSIWLLARSRGRSEGALERQVESTLATMKAELISQQLEGLVSLRKSLDSATEVLNTRLAEGTSTLDRRMSVVAEIENKLGKLATQTKNIEDIGRNIQSLADLLKPPKVRGGVGETMLENLLGQILPTQLYEPQFMFGDGQRVDAIVRVGDRMLPIDSKFPMESFQRLVRAASEEERQRARKEFSQVVKKHVDAIGSKYVRPAEGTMDFAVMYIPSEAVYYQFVSAEDTDDFGYAMSRRVIPSSPGHLYGFLASVASIFSQAGMISDRRALAALIDSIQESLGVLERLSEQMQGSLRSATSKLDRSRQEHQRIATDIQRIREGDVEIREHDGN